NPFIQPLPQQPISPLDGRYLPAVAELGNFLSEAGLNRARVHVEVEWLAYLTEHSLLGGSPMPPEQLTALREWAAGFGQTEIDQLAETEKTTQHDVKAVEYLVRARLQKQGLQHFEELTHVCCTSEDINNLSYALTVKEAVEQVWIPKFKIVIDELTRQARAYR